MVVPGVVTFELAFATIFDNKETFLVIFLTMVIVELVVALADADAELLEEAEVPAEMVRESEVVTSRARRRYTGNLVMVKDMKIQIK